MNKSKINNCYSCFYRQALNCVIKDNFNLFLNKSLSKIDDYKINNLIKILEYLILESKLIINISTINNICNNTNNTCLLNKINYNHLLPVVHNKYIDYKSNDCLTIIEYDSSIEYIDDFLKRNS